MKQPLQFAFLLAFNSLVAMSSIHSQNKPMIFSNYLHAYNNPTANPLVGVISFERKINEIILRPDSTFEYWSRPTISCFTWSSIGGSWKREHDTLVLTDRYQVEEPDAKTTYRTDSLQAYRLTFGTDEGSPLKNRMIVIGFLYDYDAHIDDRENSYRLDSNNSILIPFKTIPDFISLAALRVTYQLNYRAMRDMFLTKNDLVNVKQRQLPNVMNVEFVEHPRSEVVTRTTIAVVENDTLSICSKWKTKTMLLDGHADLPFEDVYYLVK